MLSLTRRNVPKPEDFYQAVEALQPFVKNFKVLGTYAQNRENIPLN